MAQEPVVNGHIEIVDLLVLLFVLDTKLSYNEEYNTLEQLEVDNFHEDKLVVDDKLFAAVEQIENMEGHDFV